LNLEGEILLIRYKGIGLLDPNPFRLQYYPEGFLIIRERPKIRGFEPEKMCNQMCII